MRPDSNCTMTSVGPQLLPIAFNAEVANSGDSVSVPCSILKGDMPMDISWAFNGVPIDTSKDASITVTRINKHLSTLSIDGVSARHAGEYACSASNLAGSVSRSATLTVNGTISTSTLATLFPFSVFLRAMLSLWQTIPRIFPFYNQFPPWKTLLPLRVSVNSTAIPTLTSRRVV